MVAPWPDRSSLNYNVLTTLHASIIKRVNSLSLIAVRVIGIFDFHAMDWRPNEKVPKKI